jgi:hypothetical protein
MDCGSRSSASGPHAYAVRYPGPTRKSSASASTGERTRLHRRRSRPAVINDPLAAAVVGTPRPGGRLAETGRYDHQPDRAQWNEDACQNGQRGVSTPTHGGGGPRSDHTVLYSVDRSSVSMLMQSTRMIAVPFGLRSASLCDSQSKR